MGGKRRGPACPGAHVFPFKPCHSHFLSNTRMCAYARACAHTRLVCAQRDAQWEQKGKGAESRAKAREVEPEEEDRGSPDSQAAVVWLLGCLEGGGC